MTDPETISAAARALGQLRTPAMTAARQANVAKARAARPLKPCDCARTDGTHATGCPEGRRQIVARYRERKKQGRSPVAEGQVPQS